MTNEDIRYGFTAEVNRCIQLPDLSSLILSTNLIDNLLHQITVILTTAAHNHVPAKRFLPHLRPSWSFDLKRAHSLSKRAYKAWIAAGRPHLNSHPIKRRYKTAKAAFRALLRKHQKEQRDAFYCDLNLSDPAKLFHKIRRVNGIAAESTSVLRVAGTIFRG